MIRRNRYFGWLSEHYLLSQLYAMDDMCDLNSAAESEGRELQHNLAFILTRLGAF